MTNIKSSLSEWIGETALKSKLLTSVFHRLLLVYGALIIVNGLRPTFTALFMQRFTIVVVLVGLAHVLLGQPHHVQKATEPPRNVLLTITVVGGLISFVLIAESNLLGALLALMSAWAILALGNAGAGDGEEEAELHDIELSTTIVLKGLGFFTLLALSLVPWFGWSVFRVIFGTVNLLFLGGYLWSYVLFAFSHIHFLERLGLSVMISLVGLPILLVIANRAGLPINTASVLLISILFLISAVVYLRQKKQSRGREKEQPVS